ncbi:ArgS-related anticodon-binding protein NrtL [Streptomyces palmae]|uniref:ArgS-related anticodon-binding protein NrtL n=1 Tax=Streptomyces palmae TaxID=1701085 RepID=UPI001FD79E1A|nr:DALR anticodon-binding domain-containing protein [Streptomyces palmae]
MTPAQLSRVVLRSVRHAVEAGELRVPVPERVLVETPPRPGCGDYATNVALRLAKGQEWTPREVAEILRRRMVCEPGIAGVEIAGPGFLNITLESVSHAALVRAVCARGTAYGHGTALAGTEVRFAPVEELRAAVWTDTVVRLLRAQGANAEVAADGTERVRIRALAGGAGRADRAPVSSNPALQYGAAGHGPGGDLGHLDDAAHQTGATAHDPAPHAPDAVRGAAVPAQAEAPYAFAGHPLFVRLGSDAARWALLRPAAQDVAVGDAGLLVQREGNPLFRVRYAHARVQALLRNGRQLGIEPDAGAEDIAEAADLTHERAGAEDASRARVADAARDGAGMEHAVDERAGVEHASGAEHAARDAVGAELVVGARTGTDAVGTEDVAGTPTRAGEAYPLPTYRHPAALRLLGLLGDYPRVLEAAARDRAPDRVARGLEAVADAFFRFHDACPPLPCGEQKPLAAHRSRLALADAAGAVLAGGLSLLGISAPGFL